MFAQPITNRMRCLHVAVLLALSATAAQAQPLFANLYKQQYGYSPACTACHRDGGGSPLNNFGKQFKDAGESLAAFTKIGDLDADGDGFKNVVEAMAKANPGVKESTPNNKGAWLDISSLIPKEVQEQFPDVKEYLPRDAFLTPQDIERAKGMGATLSQKDDNTIYIPLKDKRPAGAALIFPAEYQGKAFFLMLVTDRQLTITSVQPINTRQVKEAANPALYGAFKGMALDKLTAGSGQDLKAAVANAVKKAGTLVFVRLKTA
ncbi:hypothetical protein NQT62_03230 [Limnobacter humi]|uniref:Cytochrome c domain-containing protein n=1 Tax=Limnobacter humi TaxID=1778671 RepID=A0ABT1WD60_9BURK|nr:hypothetical protein [Limnobacter humi]MCQ8895451.1 hypothetical protein [Limnobacter humi]